MRNYLLIQSTFNAIPLLMLLSLPFLSGTQDELLRGSFLSHYNFHCLVCPYCLVISPPPFPTHILFPLVVNLK